MPAVFTSLFASLSNRHFRTLWTGSLLAFIGFFMSTIVQGVVAYDLTGKNGAVGIVVFAQGISQLILGPFGGALADRLSKRLVIFICQAVITAAFFVMAILIVTDLITILWLSMGSFVVGVAFSFLGPSRQAFVGEILEPNRRGNAIALTQIGLNGSRILGPLLAGIMLSIDWLDAGGAFFLMAALYMASMVTTFFLPGTKVNPNASKSVFGDIVLGLKYVWIDPKLRLLIGSFVLIIMIGFPYVTVLPGLVKSEFGRGDGSLSLLYLANASGGLIASLVVAGFADSKHAPRIYVSSCAMFAVALAIMSVMPTFWSFTFLMFIVGVGGGGFQTLNGAVIAHSADPAYYGRVMSLTFLAFALFSVVALPIGYLADATSERATLGVMGVLAGLVVVAYALLSRSTKSRSPGGTAVVSPGGGK